MLHAEFAASIQRRFADGLVGKDFRPSWKCDQRARARTLLDTLLAASLPEASVRQRYVQSLEGSIYYLTSCCVDRRYAWKVREVAANLRRNGANIVAAYPADLVPLLPSLMLARGGPGHLRQLHRMLNCFKRLPMSEADRDRMLAEIEVYQSRDPALYKSLVESVETTFAGTPEEERPDSTVQCRRCNSYKTTYDLLQTRSGDEGMTVYYLCLDCRTRWKG